MKSDDGSRVSPGAVAASDVPARKWVVALALALATAVTYAGALDLPFLDYDDNFYVTRNPAVRSGLSAAGIRWAFVSYHAANWHPLTWMSHMLDSHVFGMRAWGHHLTSVLLHAANAAILFLVLHTMTGAFWRSAFAAALFALHPLRVESVAWVAERKDVLSAFLGLLSIAAYVRSVRRTSRWVYAGALALFALSLMAKPMLVTLPFVLLLLDWWPLRRADSPGRSRVGQLLWEKVPFLALSAASGVVTLSAQSEAMVRHLPFAARLSNAVVVYVRYLGKAAWPQSLAVLYPHPLTVPPWQVIGAAALLAAITALALGHARRRPYILVGWLWYLGTLVPTLGLVQVGVHAMADRYTYVPLIGLFVALAWGAAEALGRLRRRRLVAGGLAAAILAACALGTRTQIGHWSSTERLFERALEITERNYVAHTQVGIALAARGQLGPAVAQYRQALRFHPRYARALGNLGHALLQGGDVERAVAYLGQALEIDPALRNGQYYLALALAQAGRYDDAIARYQEQLRQDPLHHEGLLGLARMRSAHPSADRRDGREALRLIATACPDGCADAHDLDAAAMALAENGRFDEAIATAERAVHAARADGRDAAAREFETRVHLYQQGRPLRFIFPAR